MVVGKYFYGIPLENLVAYAAFKNFADQAGANGQCKAPEARVERPAASSVMEVVNQRVNP